jgi:peptide/nickel transport system substrate-binding protein
MRERFLAEGNLRTIRRLIGLSAAAAVLFVGARVASSHAEASHAAAAKPTLTIGLAIAPTSLDPAKDIGGPTQIMRDLTNMSITHINPNGTISAGLATSWKYVGKGDTTFEFTLRHDVRFSDGTTVTAAAVKTWLGYFLKAKGPWVDTVGAIHSIDTIGNWTVRLNLSAPNPILPESLSELYPGGSVSSPKLVANPKLLGTETDGAGPYVLVPSQSITGDHYTFVPNSYYYDPSAIKFGKVVVKIITTPSTMLAAIRTGQLDMAYGDPTTAAAAKSAGLGVVSAPTGTVGLLLTDRGGKLTPALGSVQVRQALNYAIDRKAITKALVGAYGDPTSEFASIDGYVPGYRNYYPYDPAKAKALLKAAGYPNGFTFTVAVASFAGVFGDPVADAIAQDLSAIGVTMKIDDTSTNAAFVQAALGTQVDAFNATQGAFPIWIAYALEFGPTAGDNPFQVDDPVIDKLYAEGSKSTNPAPYWQKISEALTTQAVAVPVFETDWLYYVSPKITGVAASGASLFPQPTEWSPK